MKLFETGVTTRGDQEARLRAALSRLTPMQLTKLYKDLQDIKKGGSNWRQQPSFRGVK